MWTRSFSAISRGFIPMRCHFSIRSLSFLLRCLVFSFTPHRKISFLDHPCRAVSAFPFRSVAFCLIMIPTKSALCNSIFRRMRTKIPGCYIYEYSNRGIFQLFSSFSPSVLPVVSSTKMPSSVPIVLSTAMSSSLTAASIMAFTSAVTLMPFCFKHLHTT